MAKLAEVRKRREVAEAKRKVEEEAEQLQEEERKKLAALTMENHFAEDDTNATNKKSSSGKKSSKSGTAKIPKLDKIAIKKMKPAQLKDALKERGLEIQGNAKELLDRLLKYEAER